MLTLGSGLTEFSSNPIMWKASPGRLLLRDLATVSQKHDNEDNRRTNHIGSPRQGMVNVPQQAEL
jgi:hypothetical protein